MKLLSCVLEMDLKTDQLENDTIVVGNVSCENISGGFGNTSSESSFINPFNDSLTRISFIICYAAVFAMCVIGKQFLSQTLIMNQIVCMHMGILDVLTIIYVPYNKLVNDVAQ